MRRSVEFVMEYEWLHSGVPLSEDEVAIAVAQILRVKELPRVTILMDESAS